MPLDGTWELIGIFADSAENATARCWLSGDAELELVGGGVNTMLGSATHTLDCNVLGESESWVGGTQLTNARFQENGSVSWTVGECLFGGQYRTTHPTFMSGAASCRISFLQTGQLSVLGSWEGHRTISP